MLTDAFYHALAGRWSGLETGDPTFALAVGRGEAAWDRIAPELDRGRRALVAEVARRPVPSDGIHYLGAENVPAEGPTPVVRLAVTFGADEALGTLRECGLWMGREPLLVAYYVHPRLDVEAGTSLERTVRLDLSPRPLAPGRRQTRWLGNSRERELHDLEAVTPQCQIDEIAVDRRFYLGGVQEALAMGYDRCAYCFGRALSQR